MMDAVKAFGVTLAIVALALTLIWLGWQGNLGKGLAAFIAPGALEVIGSTSGATTDGTTEEPAITHHGG